MPPNQNLRRTLSSTSSAGTSSNQQSAADVYQIDSSSSPLTSSDALHILQSLFGRLPAPLENTSPSSDSLDNDVMEPTDEDLLPPGPATMHATFSGAVRSPLSVLSATNSTSPTTAPNSIRVWPQATSFYQSPPPQSIRAPQSNQDDVEEGLSIDGDDSQSDPTTTTDGGPWYMDMPDMPDLLDFSSSSLSADTHAQLDLAPTSSTSTTMRARIPPPTAFESTRTTVPALTRELSDATTTSGFSSSDLNPPPALASSDSLARLGLGIQHIRAPAVPASPSSASASTAANSLASTVFELRVARMTLAALSAAARARQIERECSWYSADGDDAAQPVPSGQDDDEDDSDDSGDDEVEGTGSGRSSRMSMRSSTPGSAAGSRSASPFTHGSARLARATSPGSPLRAEATADVVVAPRRAPVAVRQVVAATPSSSSSMSSSSATAPTSAHSEPVTTRHSGWMSRPPVAATWASSSSSSSSGAAARSAARRKRVAEMMLNEMRGGHSSAAVSSSSSSSGGSSGGKKAVLVRARKIKPIVVKMVGEHGVGIVEGCMM